MAKRFDLLYGGPGSGKTRSIIALIKKMHEQTGLTARVYTGDGSGEMYRNSGLVQAGLIELADFTVRAQPFTTAEQITEGYFPSDPENPTSKMVKPTPAVLSKLGMHVFEGCAVLGAYMMGDAKGGLAQRAADGEMIGGDTNTRIMDPEVDGKVYNFGGNSGAHYNLAQTYIRANIVRSKALPNIVLWTTHERYDDGERGGAFVKGASGEKTRMGEKLIGPEIVGKALTSIISRDYGNTLHFTTASKKVADGTDAITGKTNYIDREEYRIYTSSHFDPDGIVGMKYLAISRAMDPTKIKPYYVSPATDPGAGLVQFYADIDQANKV